MIEARSTTRASKVEDGIEFFRCATCKNWKPRRDFYELKCRETGSGVSSDCRPCNLIAQAKRRLDNPRRKKNPSFTLPLPQDLGELDGDCIGNLDVPLPEPEHTCEDRLELRLRRKRWQHLRKVLREVRGYGTLVTRKHPRRNDRINPQERNRLVDGVIHRRCPGCRRYLPLKMFSVKQHKGRGTNDDAHRACCDACSVKKLPKPSPAAGKVGYA